MTFYKGFAKINTGLSSISSDFDPDHLDISFYMLIAN